MKKTIFLLACILTAATFNFASAQDETSSVTPDKVVYKTALGIRLSSSPAIQNNSISLKHFINESTAVEGLFSFGDPFTLGALLEFHNPFSTPGLLWYYGGGAYIGTGKEYDAAKARDISKTYFGAQGVVGIDYKFGRIPLNLSLDWKPELNLVSDINFEPGALGFTARFTFGK